MSQPPSGFRSGISTLLLRHLTYRTNLTFDCCSCLRLMQQILLAVTFPAVAPE